MKDNKKNYKYDFSLNTMCERSVFIDDKLSFIFNIKPYMIMGYSSDDMDGDKKYDKIPKLIDGYTTYFLKANDAGSSRKIEYSYFTCKRDEMRRKGNKALYGESEPFDGYIGGDSEFDAYSDIIADESFGMKNVEFGNENINTATIKYAISNGKLDKKNVKKLLSYSVDILSSSEDRELSDILEQMIFNCYVHSKDDTDSSVLKMYIHGATLRDISDELNIGKSTVDRRINSLVKWVGQE